MNANQHLSYIIGAVAACLVSVVVSAAELVIAANPKLVDPVLIKAFEQESKIHVSFAEFKGQAAIESELVSKKATFDLALTDLGFVAGHYSKQIFREFDSRSANLENLETQIHASVKRHTIGHSYAIPQSYAIRAFGLSKKPVEARLGKHIPSSWAEVLSPRSIAALSDCGIALSSDRNVTVPALLVSIGAKASSINADDYLAVVRQMKQIAPYVQGTESESAANSLLQGHVCLAALDGSDLYRISSTVQAKGEIIPVVPAVGGELVIDTWVMPAASNKSKEVGAFITFILDPLNQAKLSNSIKRASVIPESWAQVDESLRVSPIIYPSAEIRSAYYVWVRNTTTLRLIERSWGELNAGGTRVLASRR